MKIYKLSISGFTLAACLLLISEGANAQDQPGQKPVEVPIPQDIIGPKEQPQPLEENEYETSKVLIYPNPATDYITLNFGRDGNQKEMFLFDVAGNLLKSRSIHSTITQINTSQLSPGIYLICLDNKLYRFQKL